MLKLKLQHFGHLMQTADSLEKSLMLGKIEGGKRRGHQRMRWLDGITDAMDTNLGQFGEMVKDRDAWRAAAYGLQRVGHDGWLNNNNMAGVSWAGRKGGAAVHTGQTSYRELRSDDNSWLVEITKQKKFLGKKTGHLLVTPNGFRLFEGGYCHGYLLCDSWAHF